MRFILFSLTLLTLFILGTIGFFNNPSSKNKSLQEDQSKSARIIIAPNKSMEKFFGSISIRIKKVSENGEIIISIENLSNKITKIWSNDCSWGARSWRVLLEKKTSIEFFYQNPNRIFTMNFPQFDEIPALGKIERKIKINNGDWCGFDHCSEGNEEGFNGKFAKFNKGDLVIVIFDIPQSQESTEYSVWWGIASDSYRVP